MLYAVSVVGEPTSQCTSESAQPPTGTSSCPSADLVPVNTSFRGEPVVRTQRRRLGPADSNLDREEHFEYLPVALLKPMFPREEFSREGLEELTASIRESGVIEPLIVRLMPGGDYQVVAGYRRLQAARKAGLEAVPCIVRSMTDEEAWRTYFVENIQREDISDYELAKRLHEFKRRFGYSVRQLEGILKKSPAWISQHLSMLKLEEVFTRVNTQSPVLRNVKPEEVMESLTERHARIILSQPEPIRETLAHHVAMRVSQGLELPSVRELERTATLIRNGKAGVEEDVERLLREQVKTQPARPKPKPDVVKVLRQLDKWYPAMVQDEAVTAVLNGDLPNHATLDELREAIWRYLEALMDALRKVRCPKCGAELRNPIRDEVKRLAQARLRD